MRTEESMEGVLSSYSSVIDLEVSPCTDWWMDGWTDGWMDGQYCIYAYLHIYIDRYIHTYIHR